MQKLEAKRQARRVATARSVVQPHATCRNRTQRGATARNVSQPQPHATCRNRTQCVVIARNVVQPQSDVSQQRSVATSAPALGARLGRPVCLFVCSHAVRLRRRRRF
jgi:hypothetical protein